MYASDLRHSNQTLEEKLHALYNLSRGKRMELSFRTQYMELLKKFGNPHLNLPPVIHVAGTNGKGSIIAMLKAILTDTGYNVHTYTSPHLHKFNERIELAGEPINDKTLENLIDEAITLNNGADVTFFEITTAMAFAAFSRTPADILLLEVGLGGRLDCTNVIPTAAASIIHTISYDHMEFLGDTLDDIAAEKAGIMKPDVPCIIGPQICRPETFEKFSESQKTPLFQVGSDWFTTPKNDGFDFEFRGETFHCPMPVLQGFHQIQNAGSAIAALKCIDHILPVSHDNIKSGLKNAVWPGRLENVTAHFKEIIPPAWTVFYDGGHNQAAGEAIADFIKDINNVHLIVGMMGHKDPQTYLKPFLNQGTSVTKIDIPGEESAPWPENNTIQHAKSVFEAVKTIAQNGRDETTVTILIAGSLYLADHIKRQKP